MVEGGRTALDNKTSLLNTPSPRSFSGPRTREFTPYGFGETICTYDKSALKEAVFDDDVEQFRDCEFMSNSGGKSLISFFLMSGASFVRLSKMFYASSPSHAIKGPSVSSVGAEHRPDLQVLLLLL